MKSKTMKGSRAARPGNSVLGKGAATAFLSPSLIFIGIFLLIPAFWTLYLGLTDYKLVGIEALNPSFVGIDNFTKALNDPQFLSSLKLTIIYVMGSAIFGQALLGFILAWVLNELSPRIRNIVELIVIFAWIVPGSVVAFLWFAFFNKEEGTLNAILGVNIDWLLDYPMLSIIIFNIWRGTAFSMLLFSAAIASIPKSHIEVARVAGASKMQQLRNIVLPSARSYILTNLLLITLWTFNDFGPYLLTGGGPGGETQILPIFIYDSALRYLDFGYGSAIAAIMLFLNLVISLIVLRMSRKGKK
jgi:multiple sugar transport system permease protein